MLGCAFSFYEDTVQRRKEKYYKQKINKNGLRWIGRKGGK